eukprot:1186556-Prymnesium_polylepis.1
MHSEGGVVSHDRRELECARPDGAHWPLAVAKRHCLAVDGWQGGGRILHGDSELGAAGRGHSLRVEHRVEGRGLEKIEELSIRNRGEHRAGQTRDLQNHGCAHL